MDQRIERALRNVAAGEGAAALVPRRTVTDVPVSLLTSMVTPALGTLTLV